MVRTHTMQGTFGDPFYGGNANFVGWDLLGYPGLRLAVTADEQRLGAKLTPTHRSAYDHEMFVKAIANGSTRTATRPGTSRWRLGRNQPTSSWSASARPAASPCCRWHRRVIEVVGLEAGTWLSKKDFAPDEIRNNVRDWPMAVQKANREVPTHRVNASAPTTRASSHPMMNGVGGTTLHYWAQHWRLNPWDFKVVSETTRRYGASRIPKGSTVEDWPFGIEELEPYYDKVEYEIGVSGQAGNVKGTIDRRGNVFEAPRQRDYPMPPLRSTGFLDLMSAAARTLGLESVSWAGSGQLTPVPEPVGVHVPRLLQSRRLSRRREERTATSRPSRAPRRPGG